MAKPETGPLAQYNSLKDEHLAGYFNNKAKWRHLVKSGLITKNGEVVPESVYRLKMARKEHKSHVRDMLAQAIVHKSLDLERKRQVDIRRKLEEISKMEHVRRVKNERTRRGDEDLMPLLDPNASTRIRRRKQQPNRIGGGSGDAAEGEGEGDDELEPSGLPPHPDTVQRRRLRRQLPRTEIDSKHLLTLDSVALQEYANILESMRRSEGRDGGRAGGSNLSSHRGAQPHSGQQHGGGAASRSAGNSPKRRSRSRPKSATRRAGSPGDDGQRRDDSGGRGEHPRRSSGLQLHRTEPAFDKQASYQSLCRVTLHYYGSALRIPHDGPGREGQEVTVMQQHSGGNTLRVFHGILKPDEDFTFISRRHRGYPFSLSLYIDGVMDSRVSTCCEYKHRTGVRLGSQTAHFGFVSVSEASPCYKCLVEKQLKEGKKDGGSRQKRRPQTAKDAEVGHRRVNKAYDDDFQDEEEGGGEEEGADRGDSEKRSASSSSSSSSSSRSQSPESAATSTQGQSPALAKKQPEWAYSLMVKTANEQGAGTDSLVSVRLIGDAGETARLRLDSDRAGCFERDRTDTFEVDAGADLGELTALELFIEGGSIHGSWLPEAIMVTRGDRVWRFPCGRRIPTESSDTVTAAPRDEKPAEEVKYLVTVKTGDVDRAGTDGELSLKLRGADGETWQLPLKNRLPRRYDDPDVQPFQTGQTDEFEVSVFQEIGDLKQAELLFEGGSENGYYNESVTVERDNRRWLFPFNRWVQRYRPQKVDAGKSCYLPSIAFLSGNMGK